MQQAEVDQFQHTVNANVGTSAANVHRWIDGIAMGSGGVSALCTVLVEHLSADFNIECSRQKLINSSTLSMLMLVLLQQMCTAG